MSQQAIQDALTVLTAAGYRVTKPKPRKAKLVRPTLNALGKPLSPNFDPNYKIKMPLTSIARLTKPMPKDTRWVSPA